MTIATLLKSIRISSKSTMVEEEEAKSELILMLESSTTLDLSSQNLDSEDMENLSRILINHKFPFTSLNLCPIDLRDPSSIVSFALVLQVNTQLTSLDLAYCSLSAESTDILFKALEKTSLISLNLSNTYFKNIHALSEYLLKNPHLTTLDITDNGISAKGLEILVGALASHPSLSYLNLSDNWIENEGLIALFNQLILSQNTTLRCLILLSNGMGLGSAKALAEYLKYNQKFSSLKITLAQMTTAGVKALTQVIETHSSLIDLELNGCFLKDEELGFVIKILNKNTTLRSVSLSGNWIVAKSVAALINAIPANSALMKLNFYRNNISQEGFSDFIEAVSKNTTLKFINLEANPIDDENALMFAAVWAKSSLRSFNMSFSRLSTPTIIKIAEIITSVTDRTLDMQSCRSSLKNSWILPEVKSILLQAIEQQNLMIQQPKAILSSEQKGERALIEPLEQPKKLGRRVTP